MYNSLFLFFLINRFVVCAEGFVAMNAFIRKRQARRKKKKLFVLVYEP